MLSGQEIQKGLRIAVWEGVFATVHITLTSGAFLTGFALMLGANDFEIALLTAIPLITQVLQIFSVHAVERFGRRKWISGICSICGRSLWAVIALIPLIPNLGPQKMHLFLLLFIIVSSLMSFSGAPWLSWMADLVPSHKRGSYFGMRNMILGVITIVTSLVAGRVLDHYKGNGTLEIGFLLLETAAVLCAIIAFGLLIRQPEPPYIRIESFHLLHYIREPFRSKKFKKLLSFYLFFSFAVAIALSYFPVYLLKTLNWSFSSLAMLSIGSSIMTLLTQPLWGRIVDRVGHKPVIKMTVIGVLPLPIVYLLATPEHPWLIWLDLIFTGVFWAGFNLVMFNMVFYSLPDKGRPMFLAVHQALSGIINFIAMVSGGLIAQKLAPIQFMILGKNIINYHILFALTFIMRLGAIPLINHLEEPEAQTIGAILRKLLLTMNRQFSLNLTFGLSGNHTRRNRH